MAQKFWEFQNRYFLNLNIFLQVSSKNCSFFIIFTLIFWPWQLKLTQFLYTLDWNGVSQNEVDIHEQT